MRASEREATEAITSAMRGPGRVLTVVAADGTARARAGDTAVACSTHVVEVRPAGDATPAPWSGMSTLVAACRGVAPGVVVPPAIEVAAAGRPVGDHLGLGADLHTLLAHVVEAQPVTLVVHDAHQLDLTTAGALAHALTDPPADLRAIVTQDESARGVVGLPVQMVGEGTTPRRAIAAPPGLIEDVEEARRHARDAARRGAALDAAAASEAAHDWGQAARWWLAGGRIERCRHALERAGECPAAAEVAARLAHQAEGARRRSASMARAGEVLGERDPVTLARLRLLQASALVHQGDLVGAESAVDVARAALDRVDDDRARTVAAELVDVVAATLDLARGRDVAELLDQVERPLARLGEGSIDVDAVHHLAAAAMPLAWSHELAGSRALLDRVTGVLDARRRFALLPYPLATSAWLARRRARFELALADGTRAIDLGRAAGAVSAVRFATVEVAHVEALHGRLDECRRHVAEIVPPGEMPRGPTQLGAVSALAVGELLADHPERAVALLEPVHERFASSISPAHTAWRHNLVEAYVLLGRTDDALAVLADLEAWGAQGSPRERGQIAWCRGMLAPPGEHDQHFAVARRELVAYPTVRWRAELHHLRRLLAEARVAEASLLAERLADEAASAGVFAAVEQIRRIQRAHGGVPAVRTPTVASLSVEELRVALALAEGADEDEIAARLQLTAGRVARARQRVLDLLGLEAPGGLDALVHLEHAHPESAAAVVRVLGPTVVQRGEQRLVPPPGRPATLLAIVATSATVPVERVLEILWPDEDLALARRRLRNVLARLRAAVGPVVERHGESLVLASHVDVDSHRFDELVDLALHAPDHEAVERSVAAVEAWGGEPLPAWPYDDWAMRERDRLVHRCVMVLVRSAEARAAVGDVIGALDDLDHAVALEPDARDLWVRALRLAEGDERVGRARSLRRRAADHGIAL